MIWLFLSVVAVCVSGLVGLKFWIESRDASQFDAKELSAISDRIARLELKANLTRGH